MAGTRYTDEQILECLRAAAVGSDGPLTVTAYDAWRAQHGGPSGIGIIRRFGKWHEACERAGVEATSTTKKPSFTPEAVVAAVATYLADPEATGSYSGYVAWVRGRDGMPSGPTVRNFYPWAEAKQRATEQLPS